MTGLTEYELKVLRDIDRHAGLYPVRVYGRMKRRSEALCLFVRLGYVCVSNDGSFAWPVPEISKLLSVWQTRDVIGIRYAKFQLKQQGVLK